MIGSSDRLLETIDITIILRDKLRISASINHLFAPKPEIDKMTNHLSLKCNSIPITFVTLLPNTKSLLSLSLIRFLVISVHFSLQLTRIEEFINSYHKPSIDCPCSMLLLLVQLTTMPKLFLSALSNQTIVTNPPLLLDCHIL